MRKPIRVALLGCGSIGGYVLEKVQEKKIQNVEIVVICVRSMASQGVERAKELNIPVVTDLSEIVRYNVDVVAESASHEAVQQWGVWILKHGISFIPMSLGALVTGTLLEEMRAAAEENGCKLIVPSGGIGGLDAISAAMVSGVDEVEMICRKPPVAWKDIPYVKACGYDLDGMTEPTKLFEGVAADCVTKFPQNINIAAALSLASLGFQKTRVEIWADPTIQHNTHQIRCAGENGVLTFQFQNKPVPTHPKTAYQACSSMASTLERFAASYCIGS